MMVKLKVKKDIKKYLEIDGHRIEDRFRDLDEDRKIEMLKKMYQIRHFELQIEQFIIRGMIHGTCHLYIGEEAIAVGAVNAIGSGDYITSTHRGHGHCIARGAHLDLMMAELQGKETGYCKGKGGSMHIADLEAGNLGANGIVGGSMGIATGAGLTCRMKKNGKIVICFFGDGATNRGIFHGSVNMASIWDLPVIYLCENNLYGMSASIKEAFNISKISDRKYAYGIDGLTIDGNNVAEVYNVISHYRDICLNGKGPVLVEALTYRWRGHSKSDAQIYRTKKEVKSWMDRDPIARYGKELVEHGVMTQKQIDELEREVIEEMKKASDFAQKSPFPDPATVEEDVYA